MGVRWVGQGGNPSLPNTTDADILEYILVKLTTRITTKVRTFLVKVKTHRGEPLNVGADDLTGVGHTLEREGETDGKNGQHTWCSRTMTGTRVNGKKTHGTGLFGTQ